MSSRSNMLSKIKQAITDRTNRQTEEQQNQHQEEPPEPNSDSENALEKFETQSDSEFGESLIDEANNDPDRSDVDEHGSSQISTDSSTVDAAHFEQLVQDKQLWSFMQYESSPILILVIRRLARATKLRLLPLERCTDDLPYRCFGDKGDVEDITEADIISTVEFDQTGNYLATGDKGGRVVLFERNETKKTCEYKFHTEFQSHEPEFDYLKSLEIEEKINKIKWCRRQNASHYLLSTNDKTIKLWKVFEKSLKVVAENNLSSELTPAGAGGANGGGPVRYPNHHFRSVADLKFPRMTHHDTVVAAVPRRVYANAHAYHINSISVNSDGETFISSDDLRINLWNLNIQDQSFNIVDIKPANMEELTEVITAAEFHPQSCNWFMYASSKGTIKLADMRQKALCDEHAKRKSSHTVHISSWFDADFATQSSNKRRIRPLARSSAKSFPA